MASFEKKLTATDINDMLVIPIHFMNNLPDNAGHSVDVMVDADGTQRTFGYYTRKEGNRRPIFKKGWLSYVRDKELRPGDKIIFECVERFLHYRIRAQREISLFEKKIWADI